MFASVFSFYCFAVIWLKKGVPCSARFWLKMQGLQLSYPPAQFNFQITYGAESVVPIERLFRFFALESLVLDPVRTLFPLQVPRDLEVHVTPSQWRKYKPDWESAFNEDYEYIVFLPEGLYAQVYTHIVLFRITSSNATEMDVWPRLMYVSNQWRTQIWQTPFFRCSQSLTPSTPRLQSCAVVRNLCSTILQRSPKSGWKSTRTWLNCCIR